MISSIEKQRLHTQNKINFFKILTDKWRGKLDGFDEYDQEELLQYLVENRTHHCPSVQNKLIDRNSLNMRLCMCFRELSKFAVKHSLNKKYGV